MNLYHSPRGYPEPLAIQWPQLKQARIYVTWTWVPPWRNYVWSEGRHLEAIRHWAFWRHVSSQSGCGVESKSETSLAPGLCRTRGAWVSTPDEGTWIMGFLGFGAARRRREEQERQEREQRARRQDRERQLARRRPDRSPLYQSPIVGGTSDEPSPHRADPGSAFMGA